MKQTLRLFIDLPTCMMCLLLFFSTILPEVYLVTWSPHKITAFFLLCYSRRHWTEMLGETKTFVLSQLQLTAAEHFSRKKSPAWPFKPPFQADGSWADAWWKLSLDFNWVLTRGWFGCFGMKKFSHQAAVSKPLLKHSLGSLLFAPSTVKR